MKGGAVMRDEDIIYIDGETKYVTFTVHSTSRCANNAIVITEANYALKNEQTYETVLSGKCEIKGNKIQILLSPKPGSYYLEVTATIPPETIKHRAHVYVNR